MTQVMALISSILENPSAEGVSSRKRLINVRPSAASLGSLGSK